MAWENIENRLLEPFKLKTEFPQGIVWLPESQLTVDEWLTFIADTDEELKELDIERMRFLQNRWPVEKLMQLKWENPRDRRSIWSMRVKGRAYILFFDGIDYYVIAAIAPATASELYRAVISKLLLNRRFVPERVSSKRVVRPDLLGDVEQLVDEGAAGSQDQKNASPDYVSKLLVGWVGGWIDLPVLGFWHEDQPDSIEALEEGKYVMKYKPSYGDKQREAQKRKKEEEQHQKQSEAQPDSEQAPKNAETSEKEQKRIA